MNSKLGFYFSSDYHSFRIGWTGYSKLFWLVLTDFDWFWLVLNCIARVWWVCLLFSGVLFVLCSYVVRKRFVKMGVCSNNARIYLKQNSNMSYFLGCLFGRVAYFLKRCNLLFGKLISCWFCFFGYSLVCIFLFLPFVKAFWFTILLLIFNLNYWN